MTEAELIEHIKTTVVLEMEAEFKSMLDETRRLLADIHSMLESHRREVEAISITQRAILGLAERGLLSGGSSVDA